MGEAPLWAPWRLPYIVSNKDDQPGCFLCRFRDTPAHDAANYVLRRTPRTLILLNRFPYNNGHILVAPTAHKASLVDLDDEELLACSVGIREMLVALQGTMRPQGFNVGLNLGAVAGAGLPGHVHWHIVPRWNGDTNFMTVLADTNVIPQSLDALQTVLHDWFAASAPAASKKSESRFHEP